MCDIWKCIKEIGALIQIPILIGNHVTSTLRAKRNFYNYYRRVIDLFTKVLTKCAGGELTLWNFLCVIKLKLVFDSLETHDPNTSG